MSDNERFNKLLRSDISKFDIVSGGEYTIEGFYNFEDRIVIDGNLSEYSELVISNCAFNSLKIKNFSEVHIENCVFVNNPSLILNDKSSFPPALFLNVVEKARLKDLRICFSGLKKGYARPLYEGVTLHSISNYVVKDVNISDFNLGFNIRNATGKLENINTEGVYSFAKLWESNLSLKVISIDEDTKVFTNLTDLSNCSFREVVDFPEFSRVILDEL